MSNQYERDDGTDYEAEAIALGQAVRNLDRLLRRRHENGRLQVRKVNIRCGLTFQSETLVTIAGWDEDGMPAVAFHSADSVSGALRGALNRLLNGTLDWKEDAFYKE